MQAIDFWKLSNEYSLMHAALIAVGRNPVDVEAFADSVIENSYPGYIAVRTALSSAVESNSIVTVRTSYLVNDFGPENDLDLRRTLISASALDQFFRSRGFICDHFDRTTSATQLTGPHGKFFSKKLDAANKAWTAVTSDPSRLLGKSPKQALEKWLTDNAADLGLLNRDGKPNRTGIDEICKVANWKPEGGATPTPAANALLPIARAPIHLPTPIAKDTGPRESFSTDLDDEIPF